MSKIVWNFNNFSGGEADSARQGPAGSFQSGQGIDIRKNPKEVSLSSLLEDTGWVIDGNITYINTLANFGLVSQDIVICTDVGKIYKDGVLVHTLATTGARDTIIGAGIMEVSGTQYIYWLSRISTTASFHRSTIDMNTWIDDHITISVDNSTFYKDIGPVLSEETRLVFGLTNQTYVLDNTEVVTKKMTLGPNEQIIGLTSFQNNYRVYTTYREQRSSQYFWDGTSEDYDYKVEWNGIPINGVTNDGGYDYALTGPRETFSDFYQIAGSQRQEIRVNREDTVGARTFSDYISSRVGMFYISGGRDEGINGIFSYGNYYPGMPKSLVLEYPHNSTYKILGHTHLELYSYFATDEDKVYKVSHSTPSKTGYNTTGEIISLVYDGGPGNAYLEKQIDYAYIGFGNVTATETIELYARQDGGTFKLLKTINDTHSGERGTRVDRNEFIAQGLGDFYDLEYKVVLNGSGTATPYFRGVETYITTKIKR